MSITVHPVTSDFVAEIGDVDLSVPLNPDTVQPIKDAFSKYAVLVFPDQHLTPEQHLDVAAHFGPVQTSTGKHRSDERTRAGMSFADISNINDDGSLWDADSRVRRDKLGNRLWHTDASFKYIPGRCSLLYAREIPPIGGHTEFADMRAAYDALPKTMRERLRGLVAEHSIYTSRARIGFDDFIEGERDNMAFVPQVVVRTLDDGNRKGLYIASHAGRIFGMQTEEGSALIDELIVHATQSQFVYIHRWRTHDLVIWDNRCTMHRGTEFDDLRWRRDLMRVTVSDEINSCEREGVAIP
jgi:alpha-ketoglutarate-dependent 2,4-dichlorophenoxyacetate dioxygenase